MPFRGCKAVGHVKKSVLPLVCFFIAGRYAASQIVSCIETLRYPRVVVKDALFDHRNGSISALLFSRSVARRTQCNGLVLSMKSIGEMTAFQACR
jgi:hypothetical protein